MSTFHGILIILSVFMAGMTFAVLVIPKWIDFFRSRILTGSKRVEHLAQQSTKFNSKKVRKSEVFKSRLDSILKAIEKASKEGETRIVITFVRNCHTDVEIRKELVRRNFTTHADYDGKNSLRVSWSGDNWE